MEYETEEEWSHFMAFVVHCCQCFLEHGVERFNSDLMIRMKGVNNKKSDLQYVLLEKVVRDYVAESAGIRIAIKSSDLQIHWSVELKKAGLPPRRRFVNNDQEFVRQIQLDDHSIQYYNKDAECPYGWGFIGFVMTPKSGNGITKTVHDIFGLN